MMPDRLIDTALRYLPIFQAMPESALMAVANVAETWVYRPGDVITTQGQPTRGLVILVQGQAALWQVDPSGRNQFQGHLQAGQWFNEAALLQDGLELYTVQALNSVTVVSVSQAAMRQLLVQNAPLRQAMGLEPVKATAQTEDEQTLIHARTHPWSHLRFGAIPLIVFGGLVTSAITSPSLGWVFFLLAVIIPSLMSLYLYLEWSNDTLLITNRRLKHTTRTLITLRETVEEIRLSSVQDVMAETPPRDPFALLLGYGTLTIKTAGQAGNWVLPYMGRPQTLQQIIFTGKSAPADNTTRAPIPSGPLSPFITQYPTPEGATVLRKHWMVWLGMVFRPLGLLLVVAILAVLNMVQVFGGFALLVWIILGGLFGIACVWLYYTDWDWRHDVYVIDTHTITLIHRRPLWMQDERQQILLEQVDNVTAQINGFWQQSLQYGHVRVALIGSDKYQHLWYVATPKEVQNLLTEKRTQARNRQQQLSQAHQKRITQTQAQIPVQPIQPTGTQPLVPPAEPVKPWNAPDKTSTQPDTSAQNRPAGPMARDRQRPKRVPRTSLSPTRPNREQPHTQVPRPSGATAPIPPAIQADEDNPTPPKPPSTLPR